jgi:hypothetical protein
MKLNLTGRYLNGEFTSSTGEPVYRVSSKGGWERTTTISRAMPREGNEHLDGRFIHLAQIDWGRRHYTKIRFRGDELDAKTYFRREGIYPK